MSGDSKGSKIFRGKEPYPGSLTEIEAAAREIIEENKKNYGVKAAFTETDFPARTYGNLHFPLGNIRL